MAPKNNAKAGKGKGKDAAADDKGKGGKGAVKGAVKGAQSINVRHILVCFAFLLLLYAVLSSCFFVLWHLATIISKAKESSHIQIHTDNIQCEKHAKKEEALEKLRNGTKFDEVAREFSEDKARQG
jgi:NIMA-interacting peptidyl-prolyl cis-trans isomerase 4